MPSAQADVVDVSDRPAASRDAGGGSTRAKILAAAERLFASQGVRGASLKSVTEEAGVNLAAVNYHFGSKDKLICAVFDDLASRISRRRLDLLAERKLRHVGGTVPIEDIIYAFIEPYVLHEGGHDGTLLISMIIHQRLAPSKAISRLITKYFDKVAHAFAGAMHEAVPSLDRKTLYWRYYIMVSAVLYTASDRGQDDRLLILSDGLADPRDHDELVRQLVDFVAGGVSAPRRAISDLAPCAPAEATRIKPKRPVTPAQKQRLGKSSQGANDGLPIQKGAAGSR